MTTSQKPKLLDRMREVIRRKQYSIRTEETYIKWARRYILFHDKRHPSELGASHVEQFLTHLAAKESVSASTQNQAMNAVLFLYRQVLEIELEDKINALRAKRSNHLPVVLTRDETRRLLENISGPQRLMATLLYGAGLRRIECVRLRVKDVDFERSEIIVRNGKGMKDRVTMLPQNVQPGLKQHLEKVRTLHHKDLNNGYGEVYLPFALSRKLPGAAREWQWQYVFPAANVSQDPRSGKMRRHHAEGSALLKAIRSAARQAGISKRVTRVL